METVPKLNPTSQIHLKLRSSRPWRSRMIGDNCLKLVSCLVFLPLQFGHIDLGLLDLIGIWFLHLRNAIDIPHVVLASWLGLILRVGINRQQILKLSDPKREALRMDHVVIGSPASTRLFCPERLNRIEQLDCVIE